jgi:hypothetical protein
MGFSTFKNWAESVHAWSIQLAFDHCFLHNDASFFLLQPWQKLADNKPPLPPIPSTLCTTHKQYTVKEVLTHEADESDAIDDEWQEPKQNTMVE